MRKLTLAVLMLACSLVFGQAYEWIPSNGGIGGTFDVLGDVIPVDSGVSDLGATNKYWHFLYVDTVFGSFSIGSTLDTSKFRRNGQATTDTLCDLGFANIYGDSAFARYFGGRSPFSVGDSGIFSLTSYRAVKTADSMFATIYGVQRARDSANTALVNAQTAQDTGNAALARRDTIVLGYGLTQVGGAVGDDTIWVDTTTLDSRYSSGASISLWKKSFRAGQFTLAPDSAPAMIQNDSTHFSWYALAFDDAAQEQAYILDCMEGYTASDTIDSVGVYVAWTCNSAVTDTVRWLVDFVNRGDGQLFDSTLGNGGFMIDVNNGQGLLNIVEATFSVTASAPDDILSFSIGRDPTVVGNIVGDVQLVMVRFTYFKPSASQ